MIPVKEFKAAFHALLNTAAQEPEKLQMDVLLFEFPTATTMTITATDGFGLLHVSFELAHVVTPGASFAANVNYCHIVLESLHKLEDDSAISLIIYEDTLLIMSGAMSHQLDRQGIAKDFPDYNMVFNSLKPSGNTLPCVDINKLINMAGPLLCLMPTHNDTDLQITGKHAPVAIYFSMSKKLKALKVAKALIMPLVG